MSVENHIKHIPHLLESWRTQKAWTCRLICQQLGLEKAEDILSIRPRRGQLNSAWSFHVHGVGVKVSSNSTDQSIDIDFHTETVAPYRLYEFMLGREDASIPDELKQQEVFMEAHRAWVEANLDAPEVGVAMRIHFLLPRLLASQQWPAHKWIEESEDETRARYHGFGHDFFTKLGEHSPKMLQDTRFFCAQGYPTNDVFAICALPHSFAVQLDPDCEVICLWNENQWHEIGAWSDDPCTEALKFIDAHLQPTAPSPDNPSV